MVQVHPIRTFNSVATMVICLVLTHWESKDPLPLQRTVPLSHHHVRTRVKVVVMLAAIKASPLSQEGQLQTLNRTIDHS